jgi:hypothetical protein
MKIKIFSSSFFILVIMLAGCKKFLDKQPQSNLTEDNFYKNTSEVEQGLIGAYASLRAVYNDDYLVVGVRSDDSYISDAITDDHQLDQFTNTATNSSTSIYWQSCYYTIRQCNTVLKYLNNVTDPVKKNYFEGEARFLRAHMYFNLVRLYGAVPLVLRSTNQNEVDVYNRVDTAIVYDSIKNDLSIAIAKLPVSWPAADTARVTKGAAKGMLAKVYLTQRLYASARPILQDLIDNPAPYTFLPVFTNVFGLNNEMNSEIMYAVRYKSNSNGLGNDFTFNMLNQSGSIGIRAFNDLRNAYVSTDLRKTISVGTAGYSTKYADPGPLEGDGGADFIVMRYAEIILMYAEVVNELDGSNTATSAPATALAQLNRTRARAGLAAYAATATQVRTKDAFRTALKAERRLEFSQEDTRWYDLVRWDDAVTVMNAHFVARNRPSRMQDFHRLYPIPQREIDISNGVIKQNPGY